MFVIAGVVRVGEGQREALKPAIEAMETASRAEEGNVAYSFSFDCADPCGLRVFEHWQSDEALAAHFAAPHMAAFQAALGEAGVQGADVLRYDVSSVGPLAGLRNAGS